MHKFMMLLSAMMLSSTGLIAGQPAPTDFGYEGGEGEWGEFQEQCMPPEVITELDSGEYPSYGRMAIYFEEDGMLCGYIGGMPVYATGGFYDHALSMSTDYDLWVEAEGKMPSDHTYGWVQLYAPSPEIMIDGNVGPDGMSPSFTLEDFRPDDYGNPFEPGTELRIGYMNGTTGFLSPSEVLVSVMVSFPNEMDPWGYPLTEYYYNPDYEPIILEKSCDITVEVSNNNYEGAGPGIGLRSLGPYHFNVRELEYPHFFNADYYYKKNKYDQYEVPMYGREYIYLTDPWAAPIDLWVEAWHTGDWAEPITENWEDEEYQYIYENNPTWTAARIVEFTDFSEVKAVFAFSNPYNGRQLMREASNTYTIARVPDLVVSKHGGDVGLGYTLTIDYADPEDAYKDVRLYGTINGQRINKVALPFNYTFDTVGSVEMDLITLGGSWGGFANSTSFELSFTVNDPDARTFTFTEPEALWIEHTLGEGFTNQHTFEACDEHGECIDLDGKRVSFNDEGLLWMSADNSHFTRTSEGSHCVNVPAGATVTIEALNEPGFQMALDEPTFYDVDGNVVAATPVTTPTRVAPKAQTLPRNTLSYTFADDTNLGGVTMTGRVVTGVDNIRHESDTVIEYYNLQGIRVNHPTNGTYIRRCGNSVTKVIIR